MTRKKIKLITSINFILETQPVFNKVIGKEFFEKEFIFLKNLKKDIHDIDIPERELEKLVYITKDLCQQIENCILNLSKLKYLQN